MYFTKRLCKICETALGYTLLRLRRGQFSPLSQPLNFLRPASDALRWCLHGLPPARSPTVDAQRTNQGSREQCVGRVGDGESQFEFVPVQPYSPYTSQPCPRKFPPWYPAQQHKLG